MPAQQIKYKGEVYRLAAKSELRYPRMPPGPQEAAQEVHVVCKTMLETIVQLRPGIEYMLTKYTNDLGNQPDATIIRKFSEVLLSIEAEMVDELLAELHELGTYMLRLTLPVVKQKPAL